jgi:hypothetical protein
LSTVMRSTTLPVLKSYLRMLLSAFPATMNESSHSTSSTSSSSSPRSLAERRELTRRAGPQAKHNGRGLTRSSLLWWTSSPSAIETIRIAPSSHPRARSVLAGFRTRDQMAPPCELMVRYEHVSKQRSQREW